MERGHEAEFKPDLQFHAVCSRCDTIVLGIGTFCNSEFLAGKAAPGDRLARKKKDPGGQSFQLTKLGSQENTAHYAIRLHRDTILRSLTETLRRPVGDRPLNSWKSLSKLPEQRPTLAWNDG